MADTDWKWFITPTAIAEWLRQTNRSADADYVAARDELGHLSITARVSESATDKEQPGTVVYRGRVKLGGRGQSVRAECYVRVFQNEHGKMPQLVRVRRK